MDVKIANIIMGTGIGRNQGLKKNIISRIISSPMIFPKRRNERDITREKGYASYRDTERWKINIVPNVFRGSAKDSEMNLAGRIQLIGTGYLTGVTNLCDSQWHHIACSYRANANGEPEIGVGVDVVEHAPTVAGPNLASDSGCVGNPDLAHDSIPPSVRRAHV